MLDPPPSPSTDLRRLSSRTAVNNSSNTTKPAATSGNTKPASISTYELTHCSNTYYVKQLWSIAPLWLTDPKENIPSSWADLYLARQEIIYVLWNAKFNKRNTVLTTGACPKLYKSESHAPTLFLHTALTTVLLPTPKFPIWFTYFTLPKFCTNL